jgi:hypothetical protein
LLTQQRWHKIVSNNGVKKNDTMTKKNSKTIEDLNSPEKIKERIENNLLLGVLSEINSIKDNPRMQVFITHGFLELLINILIKNKAKNGKKIARDNRSYTYSSKTLILNELDVINDEFYKVLDWFRKVRNKAAHEPLFAVTNEDLSEVKLNNIKIDLSNFTELCTNLILILINDNLNVLGPDIAPTLADWGEK